MNLSGGFAKVKPAPLHFMLKTACHFFPGSLGTRNRILMSYQHVVAGFHPRHIVPMIGHGLKLRVKFLG